MVQPWLRPSVGFVDCVIVFTYSVRFTGVFGEHVGSCWFHCKDGFSCDIKLINPKYVYLLWDSAFFFLISILIQVDLQIYLQHPVVQNFCLCLEKQKFQLLWWKNAVTKKKRRWETPRKEWSAKNAVWSAKNAVWLAKNAVAIVRLHRNLSRRQKTPGSKNNCSWIKKAVFVEKAEILQASDVAGIHPSYRLRTRKLIPGTWNCLKLMQLPSSESPFKQGAPIVFWGSIYPKKSNQLLRMVVKP